MRAIELCLSTFHADCIFSLVAAWEQSKLCLSTFHADCICLQCGANIEHMPLPQHVPCGLHLRIPINLFHTVPFASARSMRIASAIRRVGIVCIILCLSTFHADCIGKYAQKHPVFM